MSCCPQLGIVAAPSSVSVTVACICFATLWFVSEDVRCQERRLRLNRGTVCDGLPIDVMRLPSTPKLP